MLRMTKRKSRILAGLMAFVLVFSNIAANVQTVYATNIVPGSGMTLLPDLNEDPSQKTAPEETEPAEDITLNILPEAEYDEEAGQLVWNGGWDTYKYSEQEGVTLGQVLLQDSEYSALAEELTGTWSSDDTDVLAMYDDGDALVKSTGYATVTFTYEAPKAEPEVEAEAAEVPVDPTVTEAAQPENEAAADDTSTVDEGEAAEDEAVVDDGDVVDEDEVTDGEAVVDDGDAVDEGEVTGEAAADGEEVADEAGQSDNEDDAVVDAVSEEQPAADENADNGPVADAFTEEIVDEATPSNSDKVEEPSLDEEENAAPSETVTEPETLPAAPANEQNAPEPEEEYPMADGTELTWVVKVESDRVTVYSDAPYNDLMELAVEAGYEWTGFGSSRVEEFGLPTDGIWKSLDEDVVSLTADGDMTIMVDDGVCQIAYSYTENGELYVALWDVKVGVGTMLLADATVRTAGYPPKYNSEGKTDREQKYGHVADGKLKGGWGWGAKNVTLTDDGGRTTFFSLHYTDYGDRSVYCIEPGYDIDDSEPYNKINDEKNPLLGRILTFGYNGSVDNSGSDDTAYIMATQILVWEAIVGERKTDTFEQVIDSGCLNVFNAVVSFNHPLRQQILSHYYEMVRKVRATLVKPSFFNGGTYEWTEDGNGVKLELYDTNGVISEYNGHIVVPAGITYRIQNDTLILTSASVPRSEVLISCSYDWQYDGVVVYGRNFTPNKKHQKVVRSSDEYKDSGTLTGSFKVKVNKIDISLHKKDEKGNSLEGVPFTLEYNDGTGWKQYDNNIYTTDSNGYIHVTNLPANNQYQFRESVPDRLKSGLPQNVTGVVGSGRTAEVINDYKTYNLVVNKQVVGNSNKKFPFTVTLEIVDPKAWLKHALGNISTNGTSNWTDGSYKATITKELGNGESLTISNIPIGTKYTVTEAADEAYKQTWSGKQTDTINTEGTTVTVTATNTTKKISVSLRKTDLAGNDLNGVPFTLWRSVKGGESYMQVTVSSDMLEECSLNTDEKIVTANGTIKVKNLDRYYDLDNGTEYTYQFREEVPDGLKYNGTESDNGKTATPDEEVTLTNDYDVRNLTIKKEVIGKSKDASFLFTVVLTLPEMLKNARQNITATGGDKVDSSDDTKVTFTASLQKDAEFTINNIPVGTTYKISENPNQINEAFEARTVKVNGTPVANPRDIENEKKGITGTVEKTDGKISVIAVNTNPHVSVGLTKKDTEGNPINGVKFTLQYKTEDSPEWEDYPEGNPYMTDENGEIRIDGLPRYKTTSSGGELDYAYRFVEILPDGLKYPEGYNGTYEVTLNNKTTDLIDDLDGSTEAVNDYKVGSLTVTKNLTSVSYSKDVKFPFTVELNVPVYAQNAVDKITYNRFGATVGAQGELHTSDGVTVKRNGMSLVITKDLAPGETLTIGNIPIGTGYVIHEETNVTVKVDEKDVTVSYHPTSVKVDDDERTDYAAIEEGRAGIGGTILGDDGTRVEVVATNEGYLDTELALEISKSFSHVLDNEERADSADAYPEGDFTFKLSYLYNKKYKTELGTITLNKANDWTGSFAPISYTEAELKNVDADGTRNSDFWYVIEEELTEEQQKIYTRVDPVYARVQVRSFNGMITTSVQYFMDADGTKPFDSSRYSGQKFRFVNRQYDAVLNAYKAFGKMVDNEAVAPDDPEEGESYEFTLYEWENGEWSNPETKTASEETNWQTEFTRHFYYYNDDSQNIGTHWYKIEEDLGEYAGTYATSGPVYASIEVKQTGEEGKLETAVRYYRSFNEVTGIGLYPLTGTAINGTVDTSGADHGTITNTKNEIHLELFKQFAKIVNGEDAEASDEEKAANDKEKFTFELIKYDAESGKWQSMGPKDSEGNVTQVTAVAESANDWKASFTLSYVENDRVAGVYWYQLVEHLTEEQKKTYVGSRLYARVEITDLNSDGKYEIRTDYYSSVTPNMAMGGNKNDAFVGDGRMESGKQNVTNTTELTRFDFYKQIDRVLDNSDNGTDVPKGDGEAYTFRLSQWTVNGDGEGSWEDTGKTSVADEASNWTAYFESNYAEQANNPEVGQLTYWYRISEEGQSAKYTAHPVYVKVEIMKVNGLHTKTTYYKDFVNGEGTRPFGADEKISFRNVENQTTLNLYKKVTRVTDGTSEDYNDQTDDSFEFELHSGTVNGGEIVWSSMGQTSAASKASQWKANFTLNYNADDAAKDAREGSSTYWYMIRENQTQDQEKDYVNDGPVYAAVTVTRKAEDINDITTQVVYYKAVSVGDDGQITGSDTFDSNEPTYENILYRTILNLDVTKTVIGYNGLALEKPDATFTFQLYENRNGDYVLVDTAQNDGDGNVDMSIAYTGIDEGTHTYRLLEVAEGGDYRYDTTVYDFTVEVGPSHSSQLKAEIVSSTADDNRFAFANDKIFTEEDQWTPTATKTLNGQTAGADGFTFELKDEAGNVISTATSAADGSVTFATITYGEGEDGVHTYTMNERVGSSGLIIYDAKVYTVTVTVEKTAAGNRVANVAYTLDGAAVTDVLFENQTRSTTSTTPNRTGTTIPDNEVPQGPGTPEIITISDEPTPLSDFETIEDEDVPLAFLAPMTGDNRPVGAAALFGLLALGMMGAFGILASKKDEEEA